MKYLNGFYLVLRRKKNMIISNLDIMINVVNILLFIINNGCFCIVINFKFVLKVSSIVCV